MYNYHNAKISINDHYSALSFDILFYQFPTTNSVFHTKQEPSIRFGFGPG